MIKYLLILLILFITNNSYSLDQTVTFVIGTPEILGIKYEINLKHVDLGIKPGLLTTLGRVFTPSLYLAHSIKKYDEVDFKIDIVTTYFYDWSHEEPLDIMGAYPTSYISKMAAISPRLVVNMFFDNLLVGINLGYGIWFSKRTDQNVTDNGQFPALGLNIGFKL